MTYSVVRIRRGTRTVVAIGLTWTEAQTRRLVEEKVIRACAENAAAKARTSVEIELEDLKGASRRKAAPDDAQAREGSKS